MSAAAGMRASLLAALALAGAALGACTEDVTLRDPRTGQTETCAESLAGFNPWSQRDACVTRHLVQGWVTADPASGAAAAAP